MIDEGAYQFVDTNVLVYAHDNSAAEKHQRTKALIAELWESRAGCLSVQVLQEFYVTVTRKVAKPLLPESAAQIIADLSSWKIHVPEATDVLAAIEIQRRHGVSFWDAMIIRSALKSGCEVVWSEDLNSGQTYEGLRVVNPFQP